MPSPDPYRRSMESNDNTAAALERDYIVRGDLEGFGQRLLRRDRIIAETMQFADRSYRNITFPPSLESVLIPGQVSAMVLTAPRDGATIMAVRNVQGAVFVHPELPLMTHGVSMLTRIAFGEKFFEKLEDIKRAVALLDQPHAEDA